MTRLAAILMIGLTIILPTNAVTDELRFVELQIGREYAHLQLSTHPDDFARHARMKNGYTITVGLLGVAGVGTMGATITALQNPPDQTTGDYYDAMNFGFIVGTFMLNMAIGMGIGAAVEVDVLRKASLKSEQTEPAYRLSSVDRRIAGDEWVRPIGLVGLRPLPRNRPRAHPPQLRPPHPPPGTRAGPPQGPHT